MNKLTAALAVLMLPFVTNAQTQVPNDFTAGTPARAAEVNANFDTLETAVNSNAVNISTNSASITSNESSISSNETSIQSLNTAVAGISGGAGLTVLFNNGSDPNNRCAFVHLLSDRHFWWHPALFFVYAQQKSISGGQFTILFDVQGEDVARATLLDLMIKIGNLSVAVDDFRDASTNEFVCTNEKLLSLL